MSYLDWRFTQPMISTPEQGECNACNEPKFGSLQTRHFTLLPIWEGGWEMGNVCKQ